MTIECPGIAIVEIWRRRSSAEVRMSFDDPYRDVECTFCGQVLHGIDECRAHALKERYNLETYYSLKPGLPDDEFLFQVGYGTVEQIREFIDGANQSR